MNPTEWILLDTEVTGLAAPIFVAELAAQRMRGWQPDGEPFRKLLNQNADIPATRAKFWSVTASRRIRSIGSLPNTRAACRSSRSISNTIWTKCCSRSGSGWASARSAVAGFARCGWRSGCSILYPPATASCKRCGSIIACPNTARTWLWVTCKRSRT